jgi:NAD(P)-dependent dehydrogenase (short-subunit alcohol dehydrogenase family)
MKNVLVTGGAGLLGGKFVDAFFDAGYRAWGADISPIYPGVPPMDVTKAEDWKKCAYDIDILINCAGATNNSGIEGFNSTFGAWDYIMDVNLKGTMLGCQIIGRQMVERGSGCIINIASQYGIVSPRHDIYEDTGISQPLAYSVSKAGVIQLTKYLACLWGRSGVRVNAIVPGGIYNGQDEKFVERFKAHSPMERMAQPDEIVGAALYIVESTYMNGHALVIDGGWSVW